MYLVAKEELALVGSIEPGLIQAQVGIAGSYQVKHLLPLKYRTIGWHCWDESGKTPSTPEIQYNRLALLGRIR